MDPPHRNIEQPLPSLVRISPGVDLTLYDLVAVARGDRHGRHARIELAGPWREACQTSLNHLHESMETTAGKSVAELADTIRARFAGRTPPPAMAELLRQPRSDAIDRRLASRALIYGVTTGFGVNKDRMVESLDHIHEMQINLLRSHACGVGPPLPAEAVRATMLLRLRTFVEGRSCVRHETIELLRDLLNAGVTPWVPEQGSVGSSGDLCPLAHLSLVMIGEGFAWRDSPSPRPSPSKGAGEECGMRNAECGMEDAPPKHGQAYLPMPPDTVAPFAHRNDLPMPPDADTRPAPRPAMDVLSEAGLAGCVLRHLAPKEGLALINGTSISTAITALATWDASVLLGSANLAASMSLQALLGCTRAYDPKVHAIRRHAGQQFAAAQILAFARGSALLDRSDDVQDAYSLRCAPAVHGAACAAIEHVWSILAGEINAVTDNPLFFAAEGDADPVDGGAASIWKAYSAGNFHGEPVGMAADYLKIAVAELAGISERRTQSMLDRHHSRGLPANLWPETNGAGSGLNSGLMIAQYVAASLVSENKTLCHPASVDSIPTSANIEDHNAMSTIAARHARRVIDNARQVLAIEFLCAAQALDIRLRQLRMSDAALSRSAAAVLQAIRSSPSPSEAEGDQGGSPMGRGEGVSLPGVPYIQSRDQLLWPHIAVISDRLAAGELFALAVAAGRRQFYNM